MGMPCCMLGKGKSMFYLTRSRKRQVQSGEMYRLLAHNPNMHRSEPGS